MSTAVLIPCYNEAKTIKKMVQTVQMEKMERTERTVKTALLPNSKSERDIGTFPMTMEQTGHSWAKPQVKMGLTELMPFRFSDRKSVV